MAQYAEHVSFLPRCAAIRILVHRLAEVASGVTPRNVLEGRLLLWPPKRQLHVVFGQVLQPVQAIDVGGFRAQ